MFKEEGYLNKLYQETRIDDNDDIFNFLEKLINRTHSGRMGINTCIYIFQMHNRTENRFLSISNTRCGLKHNVKALCPLEIIYYKKICNAML